ncbi:MULTISPECIES: hypothetical protein [Pseudomonas]|uniref:Uncharacterized protein n=1 Tax=Pseudomonas auratipiscis TaxID=3115853 RepID=A0AB35WWU2_9PSED|nr:MULTISPECIES: hypothetical protein [Pseudomonas]MDO1434410.1 hypothetical protein [Pseudomonas aeruginosa]MEE1867606.1 hypothetical protein [Pseudomonas sp. 120P]MEE1958433.1 hypothetical protein [Pseudomonas sp. 119P]
MNNYRSVSVPPEQIRRAYLDCEFTSLDDYRELLSLALVVPNGPEFYVEIEGGWVRNDCSNFVQRVVLPQLDWERHGRSLSAATNELQDWLGQFARLEIISDAPQLDWPLLVRLAGPQGLPNGIVARSISYANQKLLRNLEFPHHALLDARLIAHFMETLEESGNL